MSTEMIKLINLRDNYLRQFRKSKNQSDYELFIYHRNQVKHKKEKDKSQYYINVVNENKNRPKKLWKMLKEVGSPTKCKTKESSISLDIGNELCFDKVKVATHFNDFFTSIIIIIIKIYFRPTTEDSEGPYSKYNTLMIQTLIKYRYIIQTQPNVCHMNSKKKQIKKIT